LKLTQTLLPIERNTRKEPVGWLFFVVRPDAGGSEQPGLAVTVQGIGYKLKALAPGSGEFI